MSIRELRSCEVGQCLRPVDEVDAVDIEQRRRRALDVLNASSCACNPMTSLRVAESVVKNGKQGRSRPSPSLKALSTHSHAVRSLFLPLRSLYLALQFYGILLAMSEVPGTRNQPGGTSQNPLTQPENVRGPGSSADGGIPVANAGQGDNPAQV